MVTRVFISYSTKDKIVAGSVSRILALYDLKCFLAHEHLQLSDEWKTRVFEELLKCDIFIPLLSKNFRESNWAAQEVGIAYARPGVVIVPISLDGTVPFGFISHIQGKVVPNEGLTPDFILHPLLARCPRAIIPGMIERIRKAGNRRSADAAMQPLEPYFASLEEFELAELVDAAITNNQLWFGASGKIDAIAKLIAVCGHRIEPAKLRLLSQQSQATKLGMVPLSADKNANAVDRYLGALNARSSRRGMRDAVARVARLLDEFDDPRRVEWHKLTLQDTAVLQAKLLESGMSSGNARKHVYALKGVMRAAVELGLMSRSQYVEATALEPIAPDPQATPRRTVTEPERSALRAATFNDPKPMRAARDRALLALLDGAGLTRSEAGAARAWEFDRERGIQVTGSGGRPRLVPLAAFGLDAATWIAEFLQLRGAVGNDPIVCRVSQPGAVINEPLTSGQAVYVAFRRLCRRAGVEPIPPHALRRGFRARLRRDGFSAEDVAAIAGSEEIHRPPKRSVHAGSERVAGARPGANLSAKPIGS